MANNVPDLMVIGDSFTAGQVFPLRLDSAITTLGYDVDVIAFSKSGDTTAAGLARLTAYFANPANEMPEMALVELGINDALAQVPLAQVQANLTAIVDLFQARGVEVLLAAAEPYFPLKLGTEQGWTDPAIQAAFRAIYPAVASSEGAFLDSGFLNGLLNNLALLNADQFHPNSNGIDRIVNNVLPEVGQLITTSGAPAFTRFEAENMQLANYAVENLGSASGGKGIKTTGVGQASFTFAGAAGNYNITVRYHDEDDGQGSGQILIDGVSVGTWAFNQETNSWLSRSFNGVRLDPGDQITLVGVSHAGEFARLDYLETRASAQGPAGVPPTFSIAALSGVVAEGTGGSTTVSFVITRSGDVSGASQIDFQVVGSGAAPADPADFVGGAFPSGRVSFAANETSKQITVSVSADREFEPDQEFTAVLTNPFNGVIMTATASTVVLNDDAPPVFAIVPRGADVGEGDGSATLFDFVVIRYGDLTFGASVDFVIGPAGYQFADASDFAGGMFPYGRVTLAPGEAAAQVLIPVVGDSSVESDETFAFTLFNPVMSWIDPNPGFSVGIIRNDDGVGATLVPPQRIEAEKMQLINYTIENQGAASGGKGVRTTGTGEASFSFDGVAGTYNVSVRYHDEHDGRGNGRILVNNVQVGNWAFDQDSASWATQTFPSIFLNPGDIVEIETVRHSGEYGRFDYVDIWT
jgi:lysophospholipase L1-like esterase